MSHYAEPVPVQRPGCLTVYAILYFLVGCIYLVAAFTLATLDIPFHRIGITSLEVGLCGSLFAIIPFLTGYGLLRMYMYSWWLVVIGNVLGILYGVVNIIALIVLGDIGNLIGIFSLISLIPGMALSGYILYWFFDNRYLFEGKSKPLSQRPEYAKTTGDTSTVGGTLVNIIAVLIIIGLLIALFFAIRAMMVM